MRRWSNGVKYLKMHGASSKPHNSSVNSSLHKKKPKKKKKVCETTKKDTKKKEKKVQSGEGGGELGRRQTSKQGTNSKQQCAHTRTCAQAERTKTRVLISQQSLQNNRVDKATTPWPTIAVQTMPITATTMRPTPLVRGRGRWWWWCPLGLWVHVARCTRVWMGVGMCVGVNTTTATTVTVTSGCETLGRQPVHLGRDDLVRV